MLVLHPAILLPIWTEKYVEVRVFRYRYAATKIPFIFSIFFGSENVHMYRTFKERVLKSRITTDVVQEITVIGLFGSHT